MKVVKKKIEQIIIVGPMKDWESAFNYCNNNEYLIKVRGAYPVSPGLVDPTRFRIVAEKLIDLSPNIEL